MRPITTTVGPLAAASANNIALSQTPTASFILNGTKAATTFQGTGTITGNVLNITAVASGYLGVGTLISGASVVPCTVKRASGGTGDSITGIGGTGTYIVDVAQTVASETLYGNATATLDVARRVLFTCTGDESANTFTVTGAGLNQDPRSETLKGAGAGLTVYTATNFKTINSITIASPAAGAITVGTNGIASTPHIRLDEWAPPYVSIQIDVTGTVNYTVQTSMDDSNSPTSPVSMAAMNWIVSPDPNVVGATTTQGSYFNNAPLYARVVLNSGTGSVTATFSQSGVVQE